MPSREQHAHLSRLRYYGYRPKLLVRTRHADDVDDAAVGLLVKYLITYRALVRKHSRHDMSHISLRRLMTASRQLPKGYRFHLRYITFIFGRYARRRLILTIDIGQGLMLMATRFA